MNDMTKVIEPRSDQLNADDLLIGPRTITVREVTIRPGTEQPVSIFYEGDNGKPYKCCKSMARVLVHAWGPDATKYIGRSMTLYCDPKVTWGGMAVGGIRISHLSHIEREMIMALTATKGKKSPFTVKPMVKAANASTQSSPALIIDAADKAARGGTETFRVHWKALSQDDRATLQLDIAKYQSIAAAADEEAARQKESAEIPDDPFGLPSLTQRKDGQPAEEWTLFNISGAAQTFSSETDFAIELGKCFQGGADRKAIATLEANNREMIAKLSPDLRSGVVDTIDEALKRIDLANMGKKSG